MEKQIIIVCPWCEQRQNIKAMPKHMIMAFNCSSCGEPVVVIERRALRIDKAVLAAGEISKLQEYILNLLEEEFDVSAELTNVDPLQDPMLAQQELLDEEDLPISDQEIEEMKNLLDNYKIPREGDMFKE